MKFLLVIVLSSLIAAGQTYPTNNQYFIPTIDFCELPKYAGQKVRITCSYSGMEEYWGLGRIKKGKCEKEYNVNLGIADYDKVPKRFQKKFTAVGNSYWNSYLIMTIVGTFETGHEGGYGHLGSNNSQFNVDKFESVELIRKRFDID